MEMELFKAKGAERRCSEIQLQSVLWAPAAPRPRVRRLPSPPAPSLGRVPSPGAPQLTSSSSCVSEPLPGPSLPFSAGRYHLRFHPRRGPFSAGRTPARKSPAFLGQIRPPAPESPTPSGSAHQRLERAPRLPSVSSGSPVL
ncbi:hypothetical protein NDU88_004084 [Pleurodeles waltl]|uniref:Uncharacterized protein n=1 Tax=Pleurodeles waltl TaxID=8319 RepID=A0AAV7M757_PLEWA|nr:hypothetical protein NDU88_004084 [Pleurodeles waltl]